jgi:hypothetical protein
MSSLLLRVLIGVIAVLLPFVLMLVGKASGVTILVCVAVIYPRSTVRYSLLVLETIMLVAFGLSWFVKGRKILSGGYPVKMTTCTGSSGRLTCSPRRPSSATPSRWSTAPTT